MTRPPYCCGKCPPIVGGGYDCTCLYVKDCPKRKDMTMWDNIRWRLSIWWGEQLHRCHKRRYKNLEGQDD